MKWGCRHSSSRISWNVAAADFCSRWIPTFWSVVGKLIGSLSSNLVGGLKYLLFSSLFGVSWSNLTTGNIFQMGCFNHHRSSSILRSPKFLAVPTCSGILLATPLGGHRHCARATLSLWKERLPGFGWSAQTLRVKRFKGKGFWLTISCRIHKFGQHFESEVI